MNSRVLLINQFFWPDMAATAQLLADLAEDLAADGWQVTALAGRARYAAGDAAPLPRREIWGDVRIRRVWCSDLGRGSGLRRVTDYATFLVTAGWFVLFGRWWWKDRRSKRDGVASAPVGPRNDSGVRRARRVVVCLSTPPLVAVLGLLARWRGARFVYKVEDLYPDVAVALGTFERRSPAARCFGQVSRALLSRADTVVAVDETMGRSLQAGGARRVAVIPNWADGEALRPDPETGEGFRAVYGLGDRFVVLYSGNLGLAHRFDAVIVAARAIAAVRPDVLFLFVGGGPRLAEVQRLAAGLASVRFLPYQPREALGALYNAADVHLVTMRDEVAGLLVPSKYAAALAAARPVLLVGGTETGIAREIEDEGLGWVCPHDPGAVVAALKEALQVRGLLEEQGRRARVVFEGRYERGGATARWSRVLRDVAAAPAG